MNKEKLTQIKNKIKENPNVMRAVIIASCVATTATALYVNHRLNEIREDIEDARVEIEESDAIIRSVNDAAKHARETGHPVTMYNELDEPVFVISAPEV